MVKFEMIQDKPEDIVFEATAQPTVTVSGQTVKVGTYSVSFSGRAMLTGSEFTGQMCDAIRVTVTESNPDILPMSEAANSEIKIYGKPE